jgi:ribulose-phosphate 3-epimerase
MITISPSILSADFSNLAKEIQTLEASGADMIHIDVMDGHFVPNLTLGPLVIKSLRKHTTLTFDVHLMIEQPENYLKSYAEAGADLITIHPESTKHLYRTITEIKNLGVKAGIALLPTTPINILDYVIDNIDLILVMSVNPGFSGQDFIPSQLHKISELAKMIAQKDIFLAADGGINEETAKLCHEAGANMLISGKYIFEGNYRTQIESLKKF